jgi:exopolysaccharide biosynthesis protein
MQALGARDAVNLDGGGSTTMTVGSELVTWPSDPAGERPIADALVLTGAQAPGAAAPASPGD